MLCAWSLRSEAKTLELKYSRKNMILGGSLWDQTVEEACSRMILVPAVNMPCMTLQHAAGAPLSLLCTEKKSMGKRLSVKTKVNGTCRWAKVGNSCMDNLYVYTYHACSFWHALSTRIEARWFAWYGIHTVTYINSLSSFLWFLSIWQYLAKRLIWTSSNVGRCKYKRQEGKSSCFRGLHHAY
jgi:hypothetical protein